MKYKQLSDGEWSQPTRRGLSKIACCDCGLVHMMQIKQIRPGVFKIRAWRDPRATAAKRRAKCRH